MKTFNENYYIDSCSPNGDIKIYGNHEHVSAGGNKVFSGYEETDPKLAFVCQVIQGINYTKSGFVNQTALDQFGRLQEDLDRSRGENVEYILTVDEESKNMASMRFISIPEEGGLNDLPSYRYSKDSLYEDTSSFLENHINKYGRGSVRDASALCHTNGDSGLSMDLLRDSFHQSLANNPNELWIMTFAESAHRAIEARFGPIAIRRVGDAVKVDVGDERTSDDLELVPTFIYPKHILEQIQESIDMSKKPIEKRRLERSKQFLEQGYPGYVNDWSSLSNFEVS